MAFREQPNDVDLIFNRSRFAGRQSTDIDTPPPEAPNIRPGSGAALRLEDAIRRAVIPRLYAEQSAKRSAAAQEAKSFYVHVCIEHAAERLLALALTGDARRQETYLKQLRTDGFTLACVCHEVVAPTVEAIGRMWEDDDLSFAEVSIKTACLQQAFGAAMSDWEKSEQRKGAHILIAVLPSEDHGFGVAVLAQLLEDAGYDVDRMIKPSLDELLKQVSQTAYDLVGLSCGSERTLPTLCGTTTALREASRLPAVRIIAGGWALRNHNEAINNFGTDGIVTSGLDAVAIIDRLLSAEASDHPSRGD